MVTIGLVFFLSDFFLVVVIAKTPNQLAESRASAFDPKLESSSNKFAYLIMKNNSFARFAHAFFIFEHFSDVLVLSMTLNDLFCG